MFSSSYRIVSEIQIHAELVRPRRVCGSGAHHDFEWLFLFYATAVLGICILQLLGSAPFLFRNISREPENIQLSY
ncbi:hypothetical protein T05_13444 [Trichinella murrelli]|uniref:Uncharacterized protein n=1 Tax=Trichinella murrelli TaxID=144512 RepID=A0A0V0U0X4_9BILA|nr:hypothetical protein T05_13444 [Trichinella murrelli]